MTEIAFQDVPAFLRSEYKSIDDDNATVVSVASEPPRDVTAETASVAVAPIVADAPEKAHSQVGSESNEDRADEVMVENPKVNPAPQNSTDPLQELAPVETQGTTAAPTLPALSVTNSELVTQNMKGKIMSKTKKQKQPEKVSNIERYLRQKEHVQLLEKQIERRVESVKRGRRLIAMAINRIFLQNVKQAIYDEDGKITGFKFSEIVTADIKKRQPTKQERHDGHPISPLMRCLYPDDDMNSESSDQVIFNRKLNICDSILYSYISEWDKDQYNDHVGAHGYSSLAKEGAKLRKPNDVEGSATEDEDDEDYEDQRKGSRSAVANHAKKTSSSVSDDDDDDGMDELDRYVNGDDSLPRKKRVQDPFAAKTPRMNIHLPEDEKLAAFYTLLQELPIFLHSPEFKDKAFWGEYNKNKQIKKPPPLRIAFIIPVSRSKNLVKIAYVKSGFTKEIKNLMMQIGHQLAKPALEKPKKPRKK